ncbi:hypothetical protein [Bradyrhizobium sp.]
MTMGKKQTPESEQKDKPSREDEARQVVQEYADDQRKIIEKLRKPLNQAASVSGWSLHPARFLRSAKKWRRPASTKWGGQTAFPIS